MGGQEPNHQTTESLNLGMRYLLEGPIASGGMGKVEKARDIESNQFCALKSPHNNGPALISRFYKEARAHCLLANSDHIVKMKGFFHATGATPYLVLEWMEGGNLKKLLDVFASDGREPQYLDSGLTTDLALRLAGQAARAVLALHDNDVAHRDLKPSNFLLREPIEWIRENRDATLKLGDLGIIDEELNHGKQDTQYGAMVGTWQYACPEYLSSLAQERDALRTLEEAKRGDIFALGLIFYELWEGKVFYKLKPDSNHTVALNAQRAVEILEKRLDEFTNQNHDFLKLVKDMLTRYPDKRPAIRDVESRLKKLEREREVAPTFSGAAVFERPPDARRKRLKRRNVLLFLTTVGVSVAIAATIIWMPPQAPSSLPSAASRPMRRQDSALESPSVPSTAHTPTAAPPFSEPGTLKPDDPPPSEWEGKLPANSDADREFVNKIPSLKKVAEGQARLSVAGQFSYVEVTTVRVAQIHSPDDVTHRYHSYNTHGLDSTSAMIGAMLRHGDSNYYSVIKGFSSRPDWKRDYRSGQLLGSGTVGGKVLHRLIYCQTPPAGFRDVAPEKCTDATEAMYRLLYL